MKKLLFGVLGLLFAIPGWSATLPSGYTELEYIESTGTQYINTGVAGFNTGSWEIYAKWMLPVETQTNSYADVFGVYYGENYNTYRVITNLKDSSKYYVSGNSKAGGGSVALSDKAINQIHTATAKNGYVIFDGVTITTSTQGTALPSDASLGIFAKGDGNGKIIARIYSVNVKKDGTLIRNFVPAKDSSGVIGMYDTVNNRFFTNTGTGTFIAGPVAGIRIATTAYNTTQFNPVVTDLNTTIATIRDVVTNTINQTKAIADLQAKKQTRPGTDCPAGKKCLLVEDNDGVPHWFEIIENIYGLPAGYTPLEYIEATGTQYIDTGVVANTDKFKFVSSISPQTTADTVMYGMMATDSGSPGITLGTLGKWRYGNTAIQSISPAFSVGNVYNSELSWKKIVINGTTYTTDNATNWDNNLNYSIYLFARNAHGTVGSFASARIYYFKIYNNNALVRDMVPAKNSSGVIGMYDLVNDVFYTNKGTGTFTAGPEI